jgi:hypothetical protein
MAAHEDPMLISYRQLRRAVGMIGIALPVVLFVGELLIGEGRLRDSISSYYWSPTMHGVFIGSLCAIGVFLWSYYGEAKWDNVAGNAACIAAVCVALFPCSPPDDGKAPTRFVHFTAAAILFLLLAYFCLVSFPGQDPNTTPTPKKPLRNKIYRCCGIAIVLCVAAIAGMHVFYPDGPPGSTVFWLESVAIWAFGWSWYIKGKGLGVVQG